MRVAVPGVHAEMLKLVVCLYSLRLYLQREEKEAKTVFLQLKRAWDASYL